MSIKTPAKLHEFTLIMDSVRRLTPAMADMRRIRSSTTALPVVQRRSGNLLPPQVPDAAASR